MTQSVQGDGSYVYEDCFNEPMLALVTAWADESKDFRNGIILAGNFGAVAYWLNLSGIKLGIKIASTDRILMHNIGRSIRRCLNAGIC